MSSVCDKKLNSYYHALSNDKIANTQIRQILAKMSLSNILFCEPYNVCSGNGNSKRLPATNPLCSHFYRICHVDSWKIKTGTHRIVKTNLFGNRSVHAYVTSSSKGARRLFFSTASVPELHMSCAWLENSELRNCPVEEAFFLSAEIV